MVEDMGFARIIVDACEDHITYEDRCIAVRDILARHRIAAEQRGKLEGARLAIEAGKVAAIDAVEAEFCGTYATDWIAEAFEALSPAKIVGEG